MSTDPDSEQDALPEELLDRLRTTTMPDASVEQRIVATLERRRVLRRTAGRPHTPWLVAAAAAAAFLIGMRVGERRAAGAARIAAPPPPAVATSDDRPALPATPVLWF